MLLLLFSLSFSLIEISIFPLHYFSLSLSLSLSLKSCAFSYQKNKKAVHFICSFVSLQSPTFKSTRRRRRSPPSKNHQTELKFQLQNPHFKPHNTAPITFKLHFSLFSNSHNTGILHSIYIYIYILLMFLLCLYCNSLFYFFIFLIYHSWIHFFSI